MADEGLDAKELVLALHLREAVFKFTSSTPMTAEAVIKAMAFVIGSTRASIRREVTTGRN